MGAGAFFIFLMLMCAFIAYCIIRLTFSLTRVYRHTVGYRYAWLPSYAAFFAGVLALRWFAEFAVGILFGAFLMWGVAISAPSFVAMLVLLVRYPAASSPRTDAVPLGGIVAVSLAVATTAFAYSSGYWEFYWAMLQELQRDLPRELRQVWRLLTH